MTCQLSKIEYMSNDHLSSQHPLTTYLESKTGWVSFFRGNSLLLLAVIFISTPIFQHNALALESGSPNEAISIEEQRQLFQQGILLEKKGKIKKLQRLENKLSNYPLVDYLRESLIRYHPEKLSSEV